jgi:hypothetical protein
MKKHPLLSWVTAAIAVTSVLIDVKYLQVPIVSLAAMVLCVAVALGNWKIKRRVAAAALLLLGGAGWAYAVTAAVHFVGHEAEQGKVIANAVRCYQQSMGHAPRVLNDLVPTFLPELPRSRSPLATPPRYKQIGDNDWCVVWINGGECKSTDSDKTCVPMSDHKP